MPQLICPIGVILFDGLDGASSRRALGCPIGNQDIFKAFPSEKDTADPRVVGGTAMTPYAWGIMRDRTATRIMYVHQELNTLVAGCGQSRFVVLAVPASHRVA